MDGSWSFLSTEQEGSVGAARDTGEPIPPRRPSTSPARESGPDNGDSARAEARNTTAGDSAAVATPGDIGEHDQHSREAREQEKATPRHPDSTGGGNGGGEDDARRRSVPANGSGGGGENASGGSRGSVPVGGAAAAAVAGSVGEAERWRMAALRSEAALADLRETLGDVVALSFRCGEDSARRRGEEEEEEEGGDQEGGGLRRHGGGGGGGSSDARGGLTGVGDAAGSPAAESGVAEGREGGGDGGGVCCGGRGRCRSCGAKASAVGVLLKR